tara:strand:+ start:6151 stop:6321 length:171 start_codon:yes stop_codon:yes gene_type:complete
VNNKFDIKVTVKDKTTFEVVNKTIYSTEKEALEFYEEYKKDNKYTFEFHKIWRKQR